MLNDIKQTPDALKELLNAYMPEDKCIKNLQISINCKDIKKIYIIASGSSRNAASTARYFIEKVTGIPVIVDFAGEFTYRHIPDTGKNDLAIVLSQSGETADVLSALKKLKEQGMPSFAITNNENSTMQKLAESGMSVHAGTEESIPATKSYTCQLMSLYILGLYIAGEKGSLHPDTINLLLGKIRCIPDKISSFLDIFDGQVNAAVEIIKNSDRLIVLGRGQNYPSAEECALKIQETSYINAFAYPTGEFMHGHLAVLDENYPVISLLTRTYDNSRSIILSIKNTNEIKKKRNPAIIAIGHDSSELSNADVFIGIPEQDEVVTPFLTTLLLQLLAYKTAGALGYDTINPRSLNKIVLDE